MKIDTIKLIKEDIIGNNDKIYNVISDVDFVIKRLAEVHLHCSEETAQRIIDESIEYYDVETFEEIEDFIIEKIKEKN